MSGISTKSLATYNVASGLFELTPAIQSTDSLNLGTINLGSSKLINQIQFNLVTTTGASGISYYKNYKVETSTDGVNWTSVATGDGTTHYSGLQTVSLSTSSQVQYIRISVGGGYTSTGAWAKDIQVNGLSAMYVPPATLQYQMQIQNNGQWVDLGTYTVAPMATTGNFQISVPDALANIQISGQHQVRFISLTPNASIALSSMSVYSNPVAGYQTGASQTPTGQTSPNGTVYSVDLGPATQDWILLGDVLNDPTVFNANFVSTGTVSPYSSTYTGTGTASSSTTTSFTGTGTVASTSSSFTGTGTPLSVTVLGTASGVTNTPASGVTYSSGLFEEKPATASTSLYTLGTVNLGTLQTLDQIKFTLATTTGTTGISYYKNYNIETSTDGVNWTSAAAGDGTTHYSGLQTVSLSTSAQVQYLRISVGGGYHYNTTTQTETWAKDIQVNGIQVNSLVAYDPTAGSFEYRPAASTTSLYTLGTIDLGAVQSLNQINFTLGTTTGTTGISYYKNYKVETSTDGVNWTSSASGDGTTHYSGDQSITLTTSVQARYLRISVGVGYHYDATTKKETVAQDIQVSGVFAKSLATYGSTVFEYHPPVETADLFQLGTIISGPRRPSTRSNSLWRRRPVLRGSITTRITRSKLRRTA